MTPIVTCSVCGVDLFLGLKSVSIPDHAVSNGVLDYRANQPLCSGSGKIPEITDIKVPKSVEATPKNDPVNHPSHYTSDPSGLECIEITRHLNFNVGNAFKYVWRAGSKVLSGDALEAECQDLSKAIWYIRDEIFWGGGPWSVPDRQVLRKMERVIESRDGEVRAFFGAVYNLYIGMGADGSQLVIARAALTKRIADLRAA